MPTPKISDLLDPRNIDISEDKQFTNTSNQLTRRSLAFLKAAEEHQYTISIEHDCITLSRYGALAQVFRCNRDITIFGCKVSSVHHARSPYGLTTSQRAGSEEKHTSTLRILWDSVLSGVRIFVGIVSAIIFVVALLALIIWNGAYLFRGPAAPDNQSEETVKRNKAVLLSLGIAVGIEIACGIDEKPDRDLAMSFGRSLGSETVHAFVVGVGGGLDIRNDRNYPAVCSSTDILMKVQWARNAARL